MSGTYLHEVGEFDFLFRKYFPRLRAFARVIVKDKKKKKDIVQDSFIKSWEERQNIVAKTFENYLFKMVRNRCLNYIRDMRLANDKLHDLFELSSCEELYRIDFVRDEPYIIFEKELQEKLDKAIDTLPARCREVFIMSRFKGMKNREIAEELNINIKNVERHISSALKVLREHFKSQGAILLVLDIISEML